MRHSDSGAGRAKALLSVLFLIIVVFVGFKIIPVYVDDYELNDYIQQQTPFWLTDRAGRDAIEKNVLDKAVDLGLPLTADNVTVLASGRLVQVSVDYKVPVDLIVATVPLHFTHSNENRQL
jgi:hypothetical protein